MIYTVEEDQASSPSYELAPTPLNPVGKLDPYDTQEDWEREKLGDERRGGEGERGAKSYDGENARSSINHSTLSEYTAAFCS